MPKKVVKVIKPKIVIPKENEGKAIKKKVAAYCRVSTELEEQQGSFKEQVKYYERTIGANDEWELAGIYSDEGISGTKDFKRNGFMRMISDCREGKIDMVLTKSITRFARNTIDTLSYVKELRELGVPILFEKEGINTDDESSKMLLTVLSGMAEEESRSISTNVKWAFKRKFESGSSTMGIALLYGYTKDKDGNVQIIEEEAKFVRDMFRLYLEGYTIREISDYLVNANAPTRRKKGVWHHSTIKAILRNEKYSGDALLQKTYCKDFLTGKREKNHGEVSSYYIENSHIGIVDKETYKLVQKEINRRKTMYYLSNTSDENHVRAKYSKYILSNILICGECGQPYRRCSWTSYQTKRIVYRCYSRTKNGRKYCKHSPSIDESIIKRLVIEAINETLSVSKEDIDTILSNLEEVMINDSPGRKKIEIMEAKIVEQINKELAKDFPDTEEVMKLTEVLNDLKNQKELRNISTEKSTKELEKELMPEFDKIDDFDETLVKRMIPKIVVNTDLTLDIYFKSGVVVTKSIK